MIYNSRLTNCVERVFLINVYNLYIIIYRGEKSGTKQKGKSEKVCEKIINKLFCEILYIDIKIMILTKLHYMLSLPNFTNAKMLQNRKVL